MTPIGESRELSDLPEIPRDVAMEAHISAIAMWCRVAGVAMGVISVELFALSGEQRRVDPNGISFSQLGLFLALGSAAFYPVGHFLAKLSGPAVTVGWILLFGVLAWRMMGLMMMMLDVFNQPKRYINIPPEIVEDAVLSLLGSLAIGTLFLALLSARADRVCRQANASKMAGARRLVPSPFRSPLFWVPMAYLGVGTVSLIRNFVSRG